MIIFLLFQFLTSKSDKFDIFVGQVGVWCPWSPNAEDIQEQEYAETQLNTLVKNYRDNMTLRDEFYAKRKDEKMTDAQQKLQKSLEEKDAWSQQNDAKNPPSLPEDDVNEVI